MEFDDQEIPQGKKKEVALLRAMDFIERPLAASVPESAYLGLWVKWHGE